MGKTVELSAKVFNADHRNPLPDFDLLFANTVEQKMFSANELRLIRRNFSVTVVAFVSTILLALFLSFAFVNRADFPFEATAIIGVVVVGAVWVWVYTTSQELKKERVRKTNFLVRSEVLTFQQWVLHRYGVSLTVAEIESLLRGAPTYVAALPDVVLVRVENLGGRQILTGDGKELDLRMV